MASITLQIQDFEIEADEIAIGSAWEAVSMLEGNSIEPGELHDEWSMLDRYIREEYEPEMDADKIADLIHGGGWEIDDLERFIHVAVCALKLRVVTERARATNEPVTISVAG